MEKEAQKLCFFGIGALLEDCFEQLTLASGRKPDFLCDNADAKWGKEFFGVKCVSPTELEKMPGEKTVVISVRDYENIYSQLRSMGIENISLACYERGYNRVNALKKLDGDSLPVSPDALLDVTGKWTLITGAARGIGLQIALAMAELGANIIAHSRSIDHSEELMEKCSNLGVKTIAAEAELSDLKAIEKMFGNLPQIDIVFNNAGISPPCHSFWNMLEQDFLDCFAVNTVAPVSICRRLLPGMLERGFGRIVNVSSSIQKSPGEMAYACSKAALDKFVHDIAPSLQGTGVAISIVDPGWLRTDMGGAGAPHSVESVIPGALLGALLKGDVNGRWFTAQDYAGLTLKQAIDKAKFIHGI
jgi:NAD(P)-dependent dehydrogenase (short-subunit alcohol dehydrogenase family)